MKITHRPYEQKSLCYGCKEALQLNLHLLTCQKIKALNEQSFIELINTFTKYNLDYNLDQMLKDYGLKDLVRKVRQRVIEMKMVKHRTNSIIRESFDSFPEN